MQFIHNKNYSILTNNKQLSFKLAEYNINISYDLLQIEHSESNFILTNQIQCHNLSLKNILIKFFIDCNLRIYPRKFTAPITEVFIPEFFDYQHFVKINEKKKEDVFHHLTQTKSLIATSTDLTFSERYLDLKAGQKQIFLIKSFVPNMEPAFKYMDNKDYRKDLQEFFSLKFIANGNIKEFSIDSFAQILTS